MILASLGVAVAVSVLILKIFLILFITSFFVMKDRPFNGAVSGPVLHLRLL
jgi:hypothetical protein